MRAETPKVRVADGTHGGGGPGLGCNGWWEIMISKTVRCGFGVWARTNYSNERRYRRYRIKTPEACVDAIEICLWDLSGFGAHEDRVRLEAIDELDPEFGEQVRAVWSKRRRKTGGRGLRRSWRGSWPSGLGSLVIVGRTWGPRDDEEE